MVPEKLNIETIQLAITRIKKELEQIEWMLGVMSQEFDDE